MDGTFEQTVEKKKKTLSFLLPLKWLGLSKIKTVLRKI